VIVTSDFGQKTSDIAMLKNYLKIALRNLLRHKSYSLINIAGLAIGMACCWLILLFVHDELTYDRFHEHTGRIYRLVTMNLRYPEFSHTLTDTKHAGRLIGDLPGVTAGVRIKPSGGLVHCGDKRFNEDRFFFADSGVFQVFTLSLLAGNPRTALAQTNTVVITAETAKKYFGADDPMGRTITLDDSLHFVVTGILKNIPHNSHFKFDFLASLLGAEKRFETVLTYFLLEAGFPPAEVERRLPEFVKKYEPQANLENFPFRLQALTDIHFYSHLQGEISPNGNVAYIYIFSAVAILVLLIACFNFMNLAIPLYGTQRAKEIGMRKVIGATRRQLVAQFIGESLVLSFIAFGFALALVEGALPWFNALVEKELAIRHDHLLMLFATTLLAGFGAGCYPAFFLSRFQASQVLKGKLDLQRGSHALRKGLVVAQFAISIIMAAATLVIYRQLVYVRSKPLGFNKEQMAVLNIRDSVARQKIAALKSELSQHPRVLAATISSTVPGRTGEKFLPSWHYRMPGDEENKHEHGHAFEHVSTFFVDNDFLAAMEIELTAGRNFSRDFPTDLTETLIINEAAVKKFEWGSPAAAIGQEIKSSESGDKNLQVIGVAKNFHYASLHNSVEPLMIRLIDPNALTQPEHALEQMTLSMRLSSNDIPATMAFIHEKWQAFDADHPLEYFFLDENFDQLYRADQRLGRIFGYFSALAIFIAGMGLFGLASFTTAQRTKEIGIRKVLGATVANIVALLSRDFIKLVIFANLLAWPIAYFAMNKWLQDFAYRIEIGWWIFALAGGLALVIALLTVCTQAVKAALANPVEALRYE